MHFFRLYIPMMMSLLIISPTVATAKEICAYLGLPEHPQCQGPDRYTTCHCINTDDPRWNSGKDKAVNSPPQNKRLERYQNDVEQARRALEESQRELDEIYKERENIEREYQRSREQIRREAEAERNREMNKLRSEFDRERQAIAREKQKLMEDIRRSNEQRRADQYQRDQQQRRAEQPRRQQKPPAESEFTEGFYEIVPEPECDSVSSYYGRC